jgi:hypothetical protein
MIEITKQGKVVSRSRNLRGLLDYARKSFVRHVTAYKTQGGGAWLAVYFDDGSWCPAEFADYSVCCRWLMARRSWDLSTLAVWPDSLSLGILAGDARH